MTLKNVFFILILSTSLTGLTHTPSNAQEETASETQVETAKSLVDSLGRDAITLLTNRGLSDAERQKGFGDLLDRGFDMKAIGKFVLGKYWRAASDSEREQYLSLFRTMIIQAYSDRFKTYKHEKFTVTGARPESEGGVTVTSEIQRPNGPSIRVDWKVFPVKDSNESRIFDVKVDGVSMSVTQRSEFASIIQREGGTVAGLITSLQAKTSKSKS